MDFTSVPEQWYTDYAKENRYATQSLADYIKQRMAGGEIERHQISLASTR